MSAPAAFDSTDDSAVLVTGGTGFLGSRLVARLRQSGRAVTVVSRQPRPELTASGIQVVVGLLDDPAVCARAVAGVSTVFHVAARVGVWGAYRDFHRDNVTATQVLLAAAQQGKVRRWIHTSTPSVVYNGRDLAGADESLPLTTTCPSPYPLTKAQAERAVLAASRSGFLTTALRPHLIWGPGDPHLVPRLLDRAARGRLRIVGTGQNRVDMVYIDNAVEAHLAAEHALRTTGAPAGRAYFITNGEPVLLWPWINDLLSALRRPPVRARISLPTAWALGAVAEMIWRTFRRPGEPPLTRFVAAELAKDHWFSIAAARRDLGYTPTISMAEGHRRLLASLSK